MSENTNISYSEKRNEGSHKRWAAMRPYLNTDKSLKILDIGCNTGFFSFNAANLGHDVLGVDIDEECIKLADKKPENKGLHLSFRFLYKESLLDFLSGLPKNHYDFVFYLSVHHHIYEQYSSETADKILNEISRISKNMFFDTGQTDEKDSGSMKWLSLIPEMSYPKKDLMQYVVNNSKFLSAKVITSTTIHNTERWAYIFSKVVPKSLCRKELTINNKKYFVDKYMWKNEGSLGEFFSSDHSFPINDYNMETRTRFYKVHDSSGRIFFVKEFSYDPMNSSPENATKIEYERGQKIKHIPNTLPAMDIDKNFLVFKYFTHINLLQYKGTLTEETRDNILNIGNEIHKILGVFDFNTNNILYKDGEFKFIDFAEAKMQYTWEERVVRLKKCFKPKTNKKAIIIFIHGLGDSLMATPAIRKLKKLQPNTELHICGLKALPIGDVWKNNPNIFKYHEVDIFHPTYWISKTYEKEAPIFKKQLEEKLNIKQYDEIFYVTMQTNRIIHRIYRIGRELGICVTNPKIELFPTDEEKQIANDFIKDKKIFVVHREAGNYKKAWDIDEAEETIKEIQKKTKLTPVIIDSEKELLFEKRKIKIKGALYLSSLPKKSLGITQEIMKKAKFFIGVDSTPMHIASSCDIPILALFLKTDMYESRPLIKNFVIITSGFLYERCFTSLIEENFDRILLREELPNQRKVGKKKIFEALKILKVY